jgi:FtsP/CotA-like multicopper oxidase with cupredoxin domain
MIITNRAFNGDIPGPTIRMKAGESVTLTVVNKLLSKNNVESRSGPNNFRTPNTTNVHTHGLHVSPKSGGDSIFQEILPGESFTYHYEIPSYHMGNNNTIIYPYTSQMLGKRAHSFCYIDHHHY